MSEPLKISILDKTDSQEFEQLVMLLKEFTIDTFVRNKPEYADLRGKQNNEIVNEAIQEYEERSELSVLTPQDIEQLKKDIESQISSAKELIEKRTNGNTETRYYVMTDEDRMVSFQQVQLSSGKVDDRVEGWRNLAYISQDYAGKGGEVINSSGNLQNSLYSKIIFDDIDRWFEENGVNYERTCTGVNMLQNINAYITAMGFLPFSKNDKNIFLEKFKKHTVSRTALKRAYSLYCQHRQREESRNKKQLLDEIEKIPEFGELTDEQKQGLVQCYLKESEKEFEIPTDKLQILNSFIDENLRNRRNSTDYELKANNMTGSLETLGIEPSIEAIPQLIQECNKKLQYIEHIGLSAEKGKDGFADCIEDDKTRLSAMQKAIKTTRNNVLGNESIEYTNDEQNLE